MRSEHSFLSFIHLFVVFLILSLGLFLVFLPASLELRFTLAKMLSEASGIFPRVGFVLIGFGLMLLIGFYFLNKKRSLQYKMLCHKTIIEEAVIEEYVKQYFKEIFPQQDSIFSHINVYRPQQLEVVIKLPDMLEQDKDALLQRMQNELGVLLARKLGYEKEFFLTLHS